MNAALLEDRAQLEGLRLVRDLMSRDEQQILNLLEAEVRRTDTVLSIVHDIEGAGLLTVPVVELRHACGVDQ